uniref:RNA/RNP complex-1-interacting phosphatase n=1 Tax=Lonchura striata TaxID=40157 RepID=UPI000B4D9C98|nr:RNA/RNP complex-1-interacting phosphatase [Lonchura striata domestica]
MVMLVRYWDRDAGTGVVVPMLSRFCPGSVSTVPSGPAPWPQYRPWPLRGAIAAGRRARGVASLRWAWSRCGGVASAAPRGPEVTSGACRRRRRHGGQGRLARPGAGFDHNLLPEERFSPQDLIRKVQERKEELGLIIDLTYTTRYYGREELPPALRHAKVPTMGHQIPNRKSFLRFRYLVRKFLAANEDNDKLIGVHCTHGLNRTGYLVCRYLIEVEGMEPNTAIELFNRARGHPMERSNYIQDLQRRAQR